MTRYTLAPTIVITLILVSCTTDTEMDAGNGTDSGSDSGAMRMDAGSDGGPGRDAGRDSGPGDDAGDDAGDDGGGYMGAVGPDLHRGTPARFRVVPVGASERMEARFAWHQRAGRPEESDLDVTLAGVDDPLIQVFSRGGRPFVRSGLRVRPLVEGRVYSIAIEERDGRIAATVTEAGAPIVSQDVDAPEDLAVELRTPVSRPRVELGHVGASAVDAK